MKVELVDNASDESITVLIQPGTASVEQIANVLSAISAIYEALGGSPLVWTAKGVYSP